jgi:hypothetical protein
MWAVFPLMTWLVSWTRRGPGGGGEALASQQQCHGETDVIASRSAPGGVGEPPEVGAVLIWNVSMSGRPKPELPERFDLRELDREGGGQPAILVGRVVEGFRVSEPKLDVGECGLAAIHVDHRTIARRQPAARLPDRTRVRLLIGRERRPQLSLPLRRAREPPVYGRGALLEDQATVEQVSESHKIRLSQWACNDRT